MALSLLDKVKQSFTSKSQDNEGWLRQGKFTPVKQIGSQINYQKQVSPLNRALYTGIETAAKPVVNSLANIGALGATALGSAQMAFNRPESALKSFNTANKLRTFAGTQGSFDQGTGWNTIKKGGLDAVQTALTGKGLKYLTPSNVAMSGLLGGGASKLSGGDFATGAGQGMGAMPQIMGFVGASNPLLAKFIPKSAGNISGRIAGAGLNVAQGVGMDVARGMPTTARSVGLDALMGLLGGKTQFDTPKIKIKGMSPQVFTSDKTILNEAKQKLRVGIEIDQFSKLGKDLENMYKQYGLASFPDWNKLSIDKKVNILDDRLSEMARQWGDKVTMGIYGGKGAQGYKPDMKGQFSNMADKKVRFEIDDSKAKLNNDLIIKGSKKTLKLSDVLSHDNLFKEYPNFKNIKVKLDESQLFRNADYNPDNKTITIGTNGYFGVGVHPDLLKRTILHEVQHIAQVTENFARGGSPNIFTTTGDLNFLKKQSSIFEDMVNKITEAKNKGIESVSVKELNGNLYNVKNTEYDDIINWAKGQQKSAKENFNSLSSNPTYDNRMDAYKRLTGEIESRDVERRMNLTPEQRARTQPYVSQGIPQNEWITKFDDNTSLSSPIKTGEVKQPTIKIKGLSDLDKNTLPLNEKNTIQQPQVKSSISTQKSLSSSEDIIPQDLVDELYGGSVGTPKSIFKESGATLTKKQYEIKKVATLKLQSENARKAQNEANDYFKSISTPAYKKGTVNLGDQLPADELLRAKKDKMAFAYQRETIQRNIEDIFGKDSKMKKYVVDNITNNENQSTNFQNTLRTKLATVFNNSGIKKGSKEDYAAADFIEGTLSLDQLKKQFPNKWRGIVKTSEEGRAVYKDLLNKINTTLKRFGYEPIPERQNYVTHTNQIQTLSERIGSLTNLSSDELPRAMAGINLETKPGRKFFSFGLQRQGGSTHEGLITALDKYIPSASRQIFHTEDIQRGRAILSFLQKSANEGDTRLSGFTSYFSQFVDHLAGKQNIIDRPIEKIFGRKLLSSMDWVRKRTGANMVGANLSSAATNFIPFTQSAATTSKPAFARGLLESALNVGKEPSVIDGVQSGFLLRRFAKEKITGTLGENIKDIATLPFKLVDKFTSTSVVAGKYFEQLAKGLSKEKAMAMADDYAQRVMADRSFAQSPLLFSSKTLGALTQFQLEVNNQMSFLMKDIPKNLGYSKAQIASSLVQFAVFSYLFNNLYEKVVGRRPQIDPIQAGLTTAEGLQNGDGLQALNPLNQQGVGFSDKTGTGQILNQLPFTSVGGGRLPITTAITNPQYYLLPPFGGGQLKKTIEGLNTYNKGYSETKTGRVRFPIEKNTTNLVKSGLFGQYSTKEARDYFSKNNSILGEKQSELMKQSNDKIGLYKTIMSDRQQNSTIEKLKDKVKQTGESGTAGNKYIYYKDGEVKTIDLTFDDTSPKLTGNKELDKKKISTYSSSITRRINDIVELNEQGQMEDSKAEAEILRLLQLQKEAKAKTTKKSTKSKGGKITIAKVTTPTIKKFKLPTIKLPNTSLKSNIKVKKPSIAQLKKRRTIKIKV